jgi:hypothetical protein
MKWKHYHLIGQETLREKEEIASDEQFLLFPQCVPESSAANWSNVVIVW